MSHTPAPSHAPGHRAAEALSPLQRGILLTLLYSDLFDYPLSRVELRRYLVYPGSEGEVDGALRSLLGPVVMENDGYLALKGRGPLVALRRERSKLAAGRWSQARRFARWLARVPFLRMVAVCGSQAVENPGRDSDVDFFLVTEAGRLWIVQVCTMLLRRLARLFAMDVCPNYLLTRDGLAMEERNLYTAREAAQAVPLWGEGVYDEFVAANGWIRSFLPNVDFKETRGRLEEVRRPRLTRWTEALLAGTLGELLDRLFHRLLLVYYPLRLAHHGWGRKELQRAYRRDRQTVVTGGYGRAVAQRFLAAAREGFGQWVDPRELERLFPEAGRDSPMAADSLYAGLFARRYGDADG